MLKIIAIFSVVFFITCTEAKPPFIINLPEDFSFTSGKANLDILVEEIFQDITVPSTFVLPSLRSLVLLEQGRIAGEFLRPHLIMQDIDVAVQVPTPIIKSRVGMFCLDAKYCNSSKSFIIVPKGFEIGLDYCDKMNRFCLAVNNDYSAFKAIENKTGDVLLGNFMSVAGVLCHLKDDDKSRSIYYREMPSLSKNNYIYLHQDYSDLVPLVDSRIQSLKKSGRMRTLLNNFWLALSDCDVTPIDLDSDFLKSLESEDPEEENY